MSNSNPQITYNQITASPTTATSTSHTHTSGYIYAGSVSAVPMKGVYRSGNDVWLNGQLLWRLM